MKTYDLTQEFILDNLHKLEITLLFAEDLNTQRESLRRLVHELVYILDLEA